MLVGFLHAHAKPWACHPAAFRTAVHSKTSGDEDIMSLENETGSNRDASDAVFGSLVLSWDNREQLLLVLAI